MCLLKLHYLNAGHSDRMRLPPERECVCNENQLPELLCLCKAYCVVVRAMNIAIFHQVKVSSKVVTFLKKITDIHKHAFQKYQVLEWGCNSYDALCQSSRTSCDRL